MRSTPNLQLPTPKASVRTDCLGSWKLARWDLTADRMSLHTPHRSQRHLPLADQSRRRPRRGGGGRPCSAARCWLATRCAAACAISCCRGSGGPATSSRRWDSSGTRWPQDLVARGAASAAPVDRHARLRHPRAVGPARHQRAGLRRRRSLLEVPRRRAARRRVRLAGARPRSSASSAGDVLLTRLQKPTEIPLESLFAHKEDIGRTVRLTVTGALPAAQLGEFALQPQQARSARGVRAAAAAAARPRGAAIASTPSWSAATESGADAKSRAARRGDARRSQRQGDRRRRRRGGDRRERRRRDRTRRWNRRRAAQRASSGRPRCRCSPISRTRSASAIARCRTRWSPASISGAADLPATGAQPPAQPGQTGVRPGRAGPTSARPLRGRSPRDASC